MAKYLAIYEDSSSTYDVCGFMIMTEKERTKYEELAESITWEFNFFTPNLNSDINYSSGEDLLNRISFKEINKEEYATFDKLFDGSFGNFPGENFLSSILNDGDNQNYGDEDFPDIYDDVYD